jgi:hypothetical protein
LHNTAFVKLTHCILALKNLVGCNSVAIAHRNPQSLQQRVPKVDTQKDKIQLGSRPAG